MASGSPSGVPGAAQRGVDVPVTLVSVVVGVPVLAAGRPVSITVVDQVLCKLVAADDVALVQVAHVEVTFAMETRIVEAGAGSAVSSQLLLVVLAPQ
jgi:hypothetical protein